MRLSASRKNARTSVGMGPTGPGRGTLRKGMYGSRTATRAIAAISRPYFLGPLYPTRPYSVDRPAPTDVGYPSPRGHLAPILRCAATTELAGRRARFGIRS